VARTNAGPARRDRALAFLGEPFFDHHVDLPRRKPEQAGQNPERDHVRPPAGNSGGEFFQFYIDDARAAVAENGWRIARSGIANDERFRSGENLGAEALRVQPVDADHQVVALRHAFDRMRRDAQQRSRFAAANLRAKRAGRQPLPTRGAGGFQQHVARGQRAGAPAADDRDRDAEHVLHGEALAAMPGRSGLISVFQY
jgi:hypothetical protein